MRSVLIHITVLTLCFQVMAQTTLDETLKRYNTRSIPYISVEELRMYQIHSEVLILDSREMQEYAVSRIPTSQYIGFSEFSSEEISERIKDKESLIVVYCSLGIRSEQIAEKLKNAGYKNVKNLYGGIFEWKNKGFPVVDSAGNETHDVHTYSKAWGRWLEEGNKVY